MTRAKLDIPEMESGFPADFKLCWLWDQQQAKPQPVQGPHCVLGGGWEVWGRQLHLSGAHQVLPPACPPIHAHAPVLQNHQTAGPLLPPGLQLEQLQRGLCTGAGNRCAALVSPAGRQLAGLQLFCWQPWDSSGQASDK